LGAAASNPNFVGGVWIVDWTDSRKPLHDVALGVGRRSSLSLFAAIHRWRSQRTMPSARYGRSIRRKLRLYGWCLQPHAFVAVTGALGVDTHPDKINKNAMKF
jgi:hypothetical protein